MVTKTAAHGNYHPQLWANRALMYLKSLRGIARLVNRAYDQERQGALNKGDVIKIRQPGPIVAKDENDLAFETLTPRSVNLTVDTYRHASFEVIDWDSAYAGNRLMSEHIEPAVDSIAGAVENSISDLFKTVGPFVAQSSSAAVGDITGVIAKMMNNKCPTRDRANMWGIVGPQTYAELLELQAFTQYQGSGDRGTAAQIAGEIGQRYGFNFVPQEYVPTHTAGALTIGAALVTNGALAIHATSVVIDGTTTLSGTVAAGDIVTIAGRDYAIAAAATASGDSITVTLTRGVVAAVPDATTVTITQSNTIEENCFFHTGAMAYAMAPLPAGAPGQAAANVATAVDPQSGLSLRMAMDWDIDTRKTKVVVDALWGVELMDDSLACRLRNAS